VAHLVTRRASRSAEPVAGNYTRYEIPSWVNEGISTYSQTRLLPGEEQTFANAVRSNRVLPITSLSAALRGTDFALAYAQSGSIISYTVNTYGPEKFAQFIAGLRTDNVNGALQKAFGLDLATLENDWRRSLNLPAIAPAASGQNPDEQAVPTIRPFGSAGSSSSSATPAAGESGGSADAGDAESEAGGGSSAVVIGGVVAVVAALLAAGGFVLVRRRDSQTPV
jgi:hypothetical protein